VSPTPEPLDPAGGTLGDRYGRKCLAAVIAFTVLGRRGDQPVRR